MTAPDRDPLTETAREVLAIQDRHRALNARTGLDLPIDINDMSALAIAAPTLARAVLRVAGLADGYVERYDHHPDIEGDYPQGVVVTAKAIRAALNGVER